MGREIITIFGFKKPSQTEFWLMVEEDANQQPPSPLSLSLFLKASRVPGGEG